MKTEQMTREDFERWLALQAAIGFDVTNPEVIAKIRDALAKGAVLSVPERVES